MYDYPQLVRSIDKTVRYNKVTEAYLERIRSVTDEQLSTLIHRLVVEGALRELTVGMNIDPKEIAKEVLKKAA